MLLFNTASLVHSEFPEFTTGTENVFPPSTDLI
jgi:hypothetical protein